MEKQEIVSVETANVVAVKRNYNKDLGEKVLQISIKVKTCKTKGDKPHSFKSIKGLKNIPVINEDGLNEGRKNRWLDMHFTKDAFKDKAEECNISNPDDLSTGFLYVKAKYVQSPSTYKLTEDEDGNNIYPTIWIKGGIVGFEAYVSDQDEFNYHSQQGETVDAVTGEIVDEPDDTVETEIE